MKTRIACILALLCFLGCDGYLRANVLVLDSSGKAIPRALVCLLGEDDRALRAGLSDEAGCVDLGRTVSPFLDKAKLLVWKPGFSLGGIDLDANSVTDLRLSLAGQRATREMRVERVKTRCKPSRSSETLPDWLEELALPPEGQRKPGFASLDARLERKCSALVDTRDGRM